MVHEVLKFPNLTKGSVLQLHCLVFIGLKLRNAAFIYSRVEINRYLIKNIRRERSKFYTAQKCAKEKTNVSIEDKNWSLFIKGECANRVWVLHFHASFKRKYVKMVRAIKICAHFSHLCKPPLSINNNQSHIFFILVLKLMT